MRRYIYAYLASCAVLTPAIAHADAAAPAPVASAAATPDSPGGDIVVTAERRSGSAEKTPISISAFDNKMLHSLQINRTTDLMRAVPSLVVAQGTVDPTTLTVFMRGAGQNAGTWLGFESAVGMYVDDTFFARLTGANLDLADIERVEVLRGPQGTLYGRNTLVGAIKYVTKKPGDTAFGDFSGEYGTDHLARFKGTVSAPISKDWAALITGNYYHRDGYFDNLATGNTKYGNQDSFGGRTALKYIGGGPFGLIATAYYSHANSAGSIGMETSPTTFAPAAPGLYATVGPNDGFAHSRNYGGDVTASWKGDHIELKSITAYLGGVESFSNDVTDGLPTNSPTNGYKLGFNVIDSQSKDAEITQEFQALGDALDGKLTYIGGLYYFHENGTQYRQDNIGTIHTLPQRVNPITNSYSAYGQATYNFTDRLSAIAGLRYTNETKTISGQTENGTASGVYAPLAGKLKAQAWTPKAGLNWKTTDTLFAYASVSRGFQGGGFNYLALANPVAFQTAFQPETVWAKEFGIKKTFLENHAHVNVAYYRNDFDNILTSQVIAGTGTSVTQNAGKARVEGIEGEAAISPIKGLNFFGTMAWTSGKYTAINPLSDAAKAHATKIPNVATWQYDFGGNGDIPVGPVHALFGADYSFIGPRYLGGTNAPITLLDAHHLLNAFIGFRPDGSRVEFKVSATNLLKAKYYVYANTYGVVGIRDPGEPQTITGSVSYSF